MVKLTSEVISHGFQYMNVSKEYELSLRGFKIISIQNLSATNDQFACINLTDNSISEINMLPQLKRLKTLTLFNVISLLVFFCFTLISLIIPYLNNMHGIGFFKYLK